MSNTNGQATAITEGADDVQHSSETTKSLGERTLTDMQMEEDNDQGENVSNGSPTTSINHELIAISETDMLNCPWNNLKHIAKMRILEITGQNILGVESNTELKQESETLTARIIDIIDNMEEPPFTIQRFAELLVSPTRHYTSRVKYLRAVEKVILITSTVNEFSISVDESQTSNGSSDLFPPEKASMNNVNGQPGHLTDATINIVTLPTKEPLHFRHDHSSHEYQQELQHHMSSTASAVSTANSDSVNREMDAMNAHMEEDAESADTAHVVSDIVDVGDMTATDKEKATHVEDTEKAADSVVESGGDSMDTTV
ncbi:hypothetical protein K450DRAFT_225381 [Umbelopsis ramanniana AG]|uniref:Uncharacterized protein n=1 Tax=Umbelopsis ramanniana AG TaxID=1314678 RepID=A0AAD5EGP5_UMBRA|nr:uncharacterized protein K450DRAFT_225381 [Umbelopsis ramanniana AG]KAI8582904.1 hypothetical protein K450DRAFT_225381 [Umbelopsis ramanniana AG]